jgi:DNA-binding NarL/FixJ family response regulator
VAHVDAVADLFRRAEACDLAIDGAFDSILLNLSLPDAPSLYQAFHEVRSVAAATPTLILADEPDDALESALLREGAQDFLVKATLDPEPLARALKRAVERQRHVNALTPAEGPETIATLPEVHEAESDEVLIKLIGAGVLASAETGVVSGE